VAKNPNIYTDKKKLRMGLYIYKSGRSKFWYVQLWDTVSKKYVRRSTFEITSIQATKASFEFANNYHGSVHHTNAISKDRSFEIHAKRFDRYLKGSEGTDSRKYKDYHQPLFRAGDGLLVYFGKYDISKVTTGSMRDYLAHLDSNRAKPLAGGTKRKHVMVIRAILRMAFEDNEIDRVPDSPKIPNIDKPRIAFTDSQYKRFIRAGTLCAERGDVVSSVKIRQHHIHMFRFIVHSFVRPTTGELFGLRHKDIAIKSKPARLEMVIKKGKNGLRESFTMPFAVLVYKSICGNGAWAKPAPSEYLFMPRIAKRDYARTVAGRIFNHIIKEAKLDKEEERLTTYSFRHYSLQKRVRDSNSRVDKYVLAKNAGTSVDMLERFYLARMNPSPEIIEKFQTDE